MLSLSYAQFNPHLVVGCWTTICFVLITIHSYPGKYPKTTGTRGAIVFADNPPEKT